MTEEELDRRHEEVVARFPGGLTPAQFRLVTLESADEDGRVYPPSVAGLFAAMSMLIKMSIDGLIENRGGGYNKPFRWCITEAGRAALAAEPDRQMNASDREAQHIETTPEPSLLPGQQETRR